MTAKVNLKNELLEFFLAALEHVRKEKNLSYSELSENAGINRQYLSDLKIGKRNPKEATQSKIALSLGYSLSSFLTLGKKLVEGAAPQKVWTDYPEPKDVIISAQQKTIEAQEKTIVAQEAENTLLRLENKRLAAELADMGKAGAITSARHFQGEVAAPAAPTRKKSDVPGASRG